VADGFARGTLYSVCGIRFYGHWSFFEQRGPPDV
jgi:hypothetical protein